MPRTAPVSNDILALLPPERRQAIIEEALGAQVRNTFATADTMGSLVQALTSDPRWAVLRQIPLSSVIRPTGGGTKAPAVPSVGRASPAGVTQTRPQKAGPKPFVRRSPAQIARVVEKVLAFVQEHPGLRSEQIQKQMGGDAKAISDALARLRADKKVKTKGEKRATTYSVG